MAASEAQRDLFHYQFLFGEEINLSEFREKRNYLTELFSQTELTKLVITL